ncbi:hypothetical protein FHG85_05190 [Tenuifilum thalassicum]|uniref:Uncharacterized protein n=1 Tax=Tenuifilum thalassicum TaxID=2590900 RepID=A0A7D4BDZ8_9BACT|nr:hypothetical protein FHG85_05190 [Tenuifilum thalassicum]
MFGGGCTAVGLSAAEFIPQSGTAPELPLVRVFCALVPPVRGGFVVNPEDYLYSSARNYAGLDSVIDVITVDIRWKTYN